MQTSERQAYTVQCLYFFKEYKRKVYRHFRKLNLGVDSNYQKLVNKFYSVIHPQMEPFFKQAIQN